MKKSKVKPVEHSIDIQIVEQSYPIPDKEFIHQCVILALESQKQACELVVRIVSCDEIQALNKQYRNKDKPTNVLSFPSELPDFVQLENQLLGDIIICAAIVEQEALTQNKQLHAHWAHMLIHGTLHLLGFDHITVEDAAIMEPLEIKLLEKLGFKNPYEVCDE